MRVDHTVDIRSLTVNVEMAGRVGRSLEVTFDAVFVQIHDDHVLWTEDLVANAGRLDDHVTRLWIPRTDIATCPGNQVILGQLHVELPQFLA
jgi:hypothetical protein